MVTPLKVNEVSIIDPTEISNEFNNHIATIGPKHARNIDSPNGDVYQKYMPHLHTGRAELKTLQPMIYNARELPLFSNRDDPNIYLPISVISVPFERIVYDQLHSYLEMHDIIYKSDRFWYNSFNCNGSS